MSDPAELLHRAVRPHSLVADEALRLVEDRFATWNRGDASALRALFHLPHISVPGGRLAVCETELELLRGSDFRGLAAVAARWDHSRLDYLDVVHWSADKAHCVATFGRHAADGQRYADGQAAYVVTRRDGRWGIQLHTGTLRPVGTDDDAGVVPTATAVLERWLAALDRADVEAARALVHLPLVELRGAVLHVVRSAVAVRREVARRAAARDWWRSELRHRVVRERSAHKVTLEVEIARLSRGGSLIRREVALTVVVQAQGRWGVQAHSAL